MSEDAKAGPRIVAAAIRFGDVVCFVERPGRHHHVINALSQAGHPEPVVGEEGFVTDDGRFVDRVEGRNIVLATGQAVPAHEHELFSEDLWR